MKSYVVKQLFKARWLAAIFAVALASPAMSQSSYCSDGSAACPDQPSSNNGNPAPSSNGAAPNQSGAYCPDGSASCPSRSGNNGNASNTNGNSNSGNTYRSDGSAGNANDSGNNGRAPSNNGGARVNPTNAATYNPDGSAGNANGRSNCGDNGCGFAGDAQRQPQANELPAPKPSNNGTSPNLSSPVQASTQNDTLDTGQVPTNPVPQPVPVVGPATPSQPASNASTQNYGSTPAAYAQQLSGSDIALNNRLSPSNPQRIENQMSAGQLGQIIRSGQIADWRTETQAAINRQNGTQTTGNTSGSGSSQTANIPQALALDAPRLLAPTNPDELAPTVPLQWSGVTGATYYQLAVRVLTTNDLVVNLSVNGTSHTAPPYTAGRTFRWNVTACNAQGCSPNRSESWTFRTGGLPSASVTSDSQCGQITRYQQAIIDGYYRLEQQRGTTKPSQAVLCRWEQLGTLDANLTDFQRSITAAANSGPNLPPAERRRIAREAVRNSPLVQKALSDLYYQIGEDYATKGVRSQLPSKANFLASAILFVNGGFDQIEQNRNESYVIRNVSNINYMASYMVNQISGYYTKRLGIDIPASKLINLSGTAIGVYADAYVSGQ